MCLIWKNQMSVRIARTSGNDNSSEDNNGGSNSGKVLVIGAGMAGLAAARQLRDAEKRR